MRIKEWNDLVEKVRERMDYHKTRVCGMGPGCRHDQCHCADEDMYAVYQLEDYEMIEVLAFITEEVGA